MTYRTRSPEKKVLGLKTKESEMKALKYLLTPAYIMWFTGFLGMVSALVILGCQAIEAPKSFNERLAYGYASVAASRNTAASMVERGRITKDEGKKVQALADQARAALELSKGLFDKGDLRGAEGQLNLALTVLTQLEAYLKGQS
jgi:predicted negative regulator of RcsB-dependent stress response